MAAIDLGTNGEVMVTDGRAHPDRLHRGRAGLRGVNISCGTRAVDGAIVSARLPMDSLQLDTIADEPPVGLTGSGLLSVVYELRQAGVIEPSGRISPDPPSLPAA